MEGEKLFDDFSQNFYIPPTEFSKGLDVTRQETIIRQSCNRSKITQHLESTINNEK